MSKMILGRNGGGAVCTSSSGYMSCRLREEAWDRGPRWVLEGSSKDEDI